MIILDTNVASEALQSTPDETVRVWILDHDRSGHSVATRNVKHFEGYGVEVINPWDV